MTDAGLLKVAVVAPAPLADPPTPLPARVVRFQLQGGWAARPGMAQAVGG